MRSLLREAWPENKRVRWIHALGFMQFTLVYGLILYLLMEEAPVLSSEGTSFLVFDASMRLVGGLFFAGVALLPYVLASAGSRKVGGTGWFLALAVCVFLAQAWLAVDALFFTSSSTAGVGLLFFPAVLATPVLLLWGYLHLARRRK